MVAARGRAVGPEGQSGDQRGHAGAAAGAADDTHAKHSHPDGVPEGEPAAKRPHLAAPLKPSKCDQRHHGHKAPSASASSAAGRGARDQKRGQQQGDEAAAAAAEGSSSKAGVRWRALNPLSWAWRGSAAAAAEPEASLGSDDTAYVASLTATMFQRVAQRAAAEQDSELEAAAAQAVALGAGATAAEARASAAGAAVAAGAASAGAGFTSRPPLTPCPSLCDPVTAVEAATATANSAAASVSAAAEADVGEAQGVRSLRPSRAGSISQTSSSATPCDDTRGAALPRIPEGSGLREPTPTPAYSRANSQDVFPFARSQPATPPTTPMCLSASPSIVGSPAANPGLAEAASAAAVSRFAREGPPSSTPNSSYVGTPANTPLRSGRSSSGGSEGGAAGAGRGRNMGAVSSEQLRSAMSSWAAHEEQEQESGGITPVAAAATAAAAAAAAASVGGAEVSWPKQQQQQQRRASDNGSCDEPLGTPPANSLSSGPNPLCRLSNTSTTSRRLATSDIPIIPEDTPVTDSAAGNGATDGEGGGADLAHSGQLPSIRLHPSGSGNLAFEETFGMRGGVPMDEWALRSASRASTPRAVSLSRASSTCSSQDRPDMGDLSVFSVSTASGAAGGGAAGGTPGNGSVKAQAQQHRLASSSSRDVGTGATLPSPFVEPSLPPSVREELEQQQLEQLTESPFAALPGQPLSLQPALCTTDQVYLPNRCVTELPVAQRGECWDVVSDVPVEAHAVQGAPKSGRSRQLQADSRTPSLLGRKVALPHPFWACGCLAPRTAEE